MKIDWEKPRRVSVSDMLYPDRGMIKWHGFILSDHNEVMAFEQAVLEAAAEASGSHDPDQWDGLLRQSLDDRRAIRVVLWTIQGTQELIGRVQSLGATRFLLIGEDFRRWIDYLEVAQLSP